MPNADIEKILMRVKEIAKQLRERNEALSESESVLAAYKTPDIKDMKKSFDEKYKKVQKTQSGKTRRKI
jgi:hypothetical protein